MRFFTCLNKFIILAAGLCISSSAFAIESVTLQLKWKHQFQFAGYYAAQELGYYRDAGLEVHIREATPDTDPIADVLSGHAQFGIGTSSLVLARSQGKPVVVLGVIFQHSPYVFYTAKNKGIETLHDFAGKQVMFEPQSDELFAYLKKEGVAPNLVKQVRHSLDPQDLISGKVDAISGYMSHEAYIFEHANFAYQTFTPRMAGIDFYGDNLFTSEQELSDHPDRVDAFRKASLRGWNYAKNHPNEVVDIILKKYSKERSREYLLFEAEQMIALLQPDLLEIGYSNPSRWNHIANVFASVGMIPREFSLEGFIYDDHSLDLSFLHRSLGASLLLFLLISLVAFYIYRINGKLADSLKELETSHQRDQWRNHVLELLAKGAPLTEILEAIVMGVESQAPDSRCSILLMDKDGKHLNVGAAPNLPNFYQLAINGLQIGANVGSCGTTAYTGKRTIVENILTHPSWAEFKELAAEAGLGSCWSEPIRSSTGKILGTFAIYHRDAHKPAETEIQLIERAAHLAGIAIEKAYAEKELQKNTMLLTKLSAEVPGIVFQFRMTPDGRSSFPFISEAVRKMYGLKPEDLCEDATPFFAFRHPDDAARLAKSVEESARNLTPWHIEYRLLIPSQGVRWRLGDARPEKQEDGSIIWHGFITDITERKKVEERIRHMAQYDSLTDLPNRALLSDRLQLAFAAAKREHNHLALMFIDLDKFKPINDKLGHAVGDELLKQAAVRMQRCMRESDTVARIGGDEFVVLLPAIDSESDALLVAEKIRHAIDEPFEIEGNKLNISTSIGIALYPEHGEDEITLSKNADIAMYYAKEGGRNIVMVYNYDMKVIGQ